MTETETETETEAKLDIQQGKTQARFLSIYTLQGRHSFNIIPPLLCCKCEADAVRFIALRALYAQGLIFVGINLLGMTHTRSYPHADPPGEGLGEGKE